MFLHVLTHFALTGFANFAFHGNNLIGKVKFQLNLKVECVRFRGVVEYKWNITFIMILKLMHNYLKLRIAVFCYLRMCL